MLPDTTDDAIFDNLQPKELFRYSQASRTAHAAVSSYIRRAFKLRRVLGRYFSENEILEFRRVQHRTGALVSGSTALQFFDRSSYPESDLDIYVPFDHRRDIALWLEEKGYVMQPCAKHPGAGLREVLDRVTLSFSGNPAYPGSFVVLEFLKSGGETTPKVQLLLAECPVASILKFHSTCVMNLIAYDRAYSLYPKGTFVARQSLVTQLPMTRYAEYRRAFKKYETRGWDVIMGTMDRNDPKSPFGPELRRLGDADCWTIPILPQLDLPPSTVEANSWTLCLRWGAAAEHGFFVVDNDVPPGWRFSYTVAQPLYPFLGSVVHEQNLDDDQNVEDKLAALVDQCIALHRTEASSLEWE